MVHKMKKNQVNEYKKGDLSSVGYLMGGVVQS